MKERCEKTARTKVSPIFLSIERAVQHLRTLGCGPNSGCAVYVQSDLEENGDRRIKAALDGAPPDKQALPPPINNDGINIIVAGLTETSGIASTSGAKRHFTRPHDPDRADRLRSVWQKSFTDPSRLVLEPYCPSN
jgi:hypothetical protein